MAEFERTRTREREAPKNNVYEVALKLGHERTQRNIMGRIVCKEGECPQQLTRQGRLRYYMGPTIEDTPLQDWIVFTHEIRTVSGRHKHQGGLIIYVIDGKGYSVVDGERCEWEKGDLVLLPMREAGVEHQHFNSDPDKPSVWMAFIHGPTSEYLASEMTQTEVAPEYKQAEEKAGR